MFKPSFRRPRLRLLPIMLLAVFSMLSLKVSALWTDFSDLSAAMSLEQNKAQAGEAGAPANPAACQTAKLEDQPADQSRFSQSEIDLLQALRSRRALLDQREKELNDRESFIQAAEKRLDDKVASLEGMKSDMLKLLDQRSVQQESRAKEEDARLRSLVRIYESMKPKEAAQILQRLDMDVLLGVAERMKEQKFALILGAMDPERAQTITALLADRRIAQTTGDIAK
jgi:flagellar motility protein MotE (MotC chaperone)